MLTCPVCRSQNMDTAKFCGNCGNPFPRPSMPTSSLINCPQGHVYSAIYQYCPYCPQPESASSAPETQNDFATRIEEPATAFEPPNSFPELSPSLASTTISASEPTGEFSTNAEPFLNYETRIGSFEAIEDPQVFETRVGGIEVSEVLEQKVVTKQTSAPTEVISHLAETTIAEMPALNFEPPKFEPPPPMKPPVAPPPQPPLAQAATVVSSDPPKLDAFAPASKPAPADDRRTILVMDQNAPQRAAKGKLVGWLVSYTRNPDGEDFQLFSGYNRIGANPVCDIVLDDETISGSHAIIVHRDGRFLIKDDLSRNGTFINGREISESHPLQSYDQIRLGNTVMTFVTAQPTS